MMTFPLLLSLKNGSLLMKLNTTTLASVCWNCAKGDELGRTLWTKRHGTTSPTKLLYEILLLKQGSLLLRFSSLVQGSRCHHLGIGILPPMLPLLLFLNPSHFSLQLLLLLLSSLHPFLLHVVLLASVNPRLIHLATYNHGAAKPTLLLPLCLPLPLTRSVDLHHHPPACSKLKFMGTTLTPDIKNTSLLVSRSPPLL